jgi:imidazolonepropionase-like amidohydrolase
MPKTARAALVLSSLTLSASVSAQDLVLTNARIVDPSTQTITDGSLWIQGGRIAARGATPPSHVNARRIDLQGKWVIPGLVDLHTHSFGSVAPPRVTDAGGTQATAERVLRAGVTAFLDLFGDERYLFRLRERQRAGEIGGAEIFAAGPCFTATRGHCSEYGVKTRLIDSPADVQRELTDLLPKRPDVIKVVYDHLDRGPRTMPSIDKATLIALLTGARAAGVRTVVHVGTWQDVRDAVEGGASAVTHVPNDGVVPVEVPALMRGAGVYHIPTLVVHSDLAELFQRSELVASPLAVALASDTLRAVYRKGVDSLDKLVRHSVEHQRSRLPAAIESVRRLSAAGIPMLTGTDAGNWGVIQGYSVHRELIRLVEAGLTPWQALAGSTSLAGEFLGRKFGVRPGDDANLVVLDANPLDDIANTQRITMVVMRGKVVVGN